MLKIKKLVIMFSLIISLIALSLGATSAYAAGSNNSNSQISPTLLEAQVYAKHFGVTTDEAIKRFKITDSYAGLRNTLSEKESATFGGLWVQNEPEFKIVVAFTNNGEATLAKYIPQNLPAYVEVRTVSSSYIALENICDKLTNELENIKMQSLISSVDIVNNCVEISILKTDSDKYSNAVQTGVISQSDKVTIKYMDTPPETTSTVYGGLFMTYTTVGFTVTNGSTYGIVSAGHGSHTQNITPVEGGWFAATAQGGYRAGNYDYWWYTCPAGTTLNRNCRYFGSYPYYVAPVTGTRNTTDLVVGGTVAKYGKATYYTAGTISSLSANIISYDSYNDCYWSYTSFVEVADTYGYNPLTYEGDSGGPWFVGDGGSGLLAIGLTSCKDPYGNAYFMPVNRISASGLSVVTQ